MANSELYNKEFKVPVNVLNRIKAVLVSHPQGTGVKRAKFITNNSSITYQAMKGLKNYFDNYDQRKDDNVQYELSGGLLMKAFVDDTLTQNRDAIERSKRHQSDLHANPNSELKPYQSPRLSEGEDDEELKQNAVAVIINKDKKVLILKRSSYPKQWMPNKWALVGGAIEEGENAEEACIREVKEETTLEGFFIKNSFKIQRQEDSVEHIFVCIFDGNDDDVKINEESADFGWFGLDEIGHLDKVPNMVEYILLAVKKYD